MNTLPVNIFHELPTPFFYYDMDVLNDTISTIQNLQKKYGFKMHYALKANSNSRILEAMQKAGFGADCVSGNEISRAIESGFHPGLIAFAGVGKSDNEIITGLKHDIFSFNVESVQELIVINELAGSLNKTARIALRINPNVDAKTHHYITTGIEENKFGINPWEFDNVLNILKNSDNLKLSGLHFHIGSQIRDLAVFKGLCIRVNEIQEWFASQHIKPDHINLGGGLGIDYHHPDTMPDFDAFFNLFPKFLKLRPQQELHFEFGRSLVAQSGSLISRVLYVKKGISTNFAILDAGMTELIRPALYQSFHTIENLDSQKAVQVYDVVGPICESSDCFGKAVQLPETQRGDIIAIRSAGAYGEVMSSQYNLRSKAPAYYSDEINDEHNSTHTTNKI